MAFHLVILILSSMTEIKDRLPPAVIPCRKIEGISAILLPFRQDGSIDWTGFCAHIARTADQGLFPAVNMDTGFANLIDETTRREVLSQSMQVMGGRSFYAGAFVSDKPGDPYTQDNYARQIEQCRIFGGTPVIFQSFGLVGLEQNDLLRAYSELAKYTPEFVAFELGEMFAPFGKIYDLETYAGLLSISACIGAKHSSLNRQLEWQRLALRKQIRPEFKVFTGNDLAIDMVMYGSDYLLGLSTFAPDYFARRDAYWLSGDSRFYTLNDWLQYLGHFAFRPPTSAYKHSAAQFLKLRGWIDCSDTHPSASKRPSSDVEILGHILTALEACQ